MSKTTQTLEHRAEAELRNTSWLLSLKTQILINTELMIKNLIDIFGNQKFDGSQNLES